MQPQSPSESKARGLRSSPSHANRGDKAPLRQDHASDWGDPVEKQTEPASCVSSHSPSFTMKRDAELLTAASLPADGFCSSTTCPKRPCFSTHLTRAWSRGGWFGLGMPLTVKGGDRIVSLFSFFSPFPLFAVCSVVLVFAVFAVFSVFSVFAVFLCALEFLYLRCVGCVSAVPSLVLFSFQLQNIQRFVLVMTDK